MAHDIARISLVQSINLQTGAYVSTKATITFPQAPVSPNQNASFEQTILNRGFRGFKLVVVVNNANLGGGAGSLTPIVNECLDSSNPVSSEPQSGTPLYAKSFAKSAAITAAGIYILECYPTFTPASGNTDMFQDVLGRKFNVVLQHNNANPMIYDAYLDLLP